MTLTYMHDSEPAAVVIYNGTFTFYDIRPVNVQFIISLY